MTHDARHRDVVEAWRRARYEALRRDAGWLTLAGLDWLKPGTNRLGTDASMDIVLPSGPAQTGTVILTDGRAVADGAFTHAGQPVSQLPLVSDADGEPTMLELGALRFCLIERGGRLAIRTWDTDSATRRSFDGIDHWPVDRAWRLSARFEPTPGRMLAVPDVIGVIEDEESPGDLAFEAAGAQHRLQALPGGERGEMWLVFGDATNGRETYGGGRFLYTGPPDADGVVELDFNRSYNPPCVFSPYATCPLPWPANRLSIRVEAGEREFHH
ncbi:MAG: DUF1684 domain-containing protein [Candidatus Limnocylindria bacterium]